MDEFVCSCCCEPIYFEPESWAYESLPADPYQVAYAEPTYAEPVYAEPVYAEPVYVEPVYVEPVYVEPVYVEPVYEAPAYVEPVYLEPAVFAPVYEAPAYVEPLSLAPQTAEIGGWDQGWTVVAPSAVVAPQTVLANVPVVSGSDPGLSLSEALASATFGGNPWDTSVYQVYNQSFAAHPISVAAPAWTAYTDPLINGALVANELALQNIRNASRPLS